MSIPIQHSPAPEQGAQEPLSQDNEQRSRSGFVGSQDAHRAAIGRGVEVNLSATSRPVKPNSEDGEAQREPAGVAGLGVDGIGVSIRHVDQKCVEGSFSGDSRAKTSPAVLPANPGPRAAMGQAPFSGKR